VGVHFESRPDLTQNLSGFHHSFEIRRGADKSLALPISYFSIWSKTKGIFLGWVKEVKTRSHKCVELRG
jgi:hypothetical protein